MNSKSVFSNFLWRFLERCGAQAVTFVVSIILARLLDPEVYGLVALVTVFTTVMQVFVDSGMGNALIQKKNADDLDFSSVFWFNLGMCSLLYLIMFFLAPLIAAFYKMPDLTPIIRVISLMLVISGIKNIQQAYVSRNMLFKRFFFATLGGTIGAAIVGILMAYYGFGVWALVAQMLFNATVDTAILWLTVKWRPKVVFSFNRLKGLFSYGWKLLCSSLINTLYTKIRQLIIGKHYSSADLAFYTKGDLFPNALVTNINTSIDSVLLPAMSQAQDERDNVRSMTRRAIKTSTYIMMPMMFGLTVIATPLVRVLLTEKWLESVFFLRIFCFVYAFQPLQTANLNAIKAMGRSDLFLRLEIIKKLVGLTAMLATVFISVKVMACSYLITTILSVCINSYPNKKLLNYSIKQQLLDIIPSVALSTVMFMSCLCVKFLNLADIPTILLQIVVGASMYIGLSVLFKLESFTYLITVCRRILDKNERKKQ